MVDEVFSKFDKDKNGLLRIPLFKQILSEEFGLQVNYDIAIGSRVQEQK